MTTLAPVPSTPSPNLPTLTRADLEIFRDRGFARQHFQMRHPAGIKVEGEAPGRYVAWITEKYFFEAVHAAGYTRIDVDKVKVDLTPHADFEGFELILQVRCARPKLQ